MKCNCGSGMLSYWVFDARSIPLAKVCDECKNKKLKAFRVEVLTNSNYDCDEPIEPEDY